MRTVRSPGINLGALSEEQEATWKTIASADGHKGFRPDERRVCSKQGVPPPDGAHDRSSQSFSATLADGRVEVCDTIAVYSEPFRADFQRDDSAIDAKHGRPFGNDATAHRFEILGM